MSIELRKQTVRIVLQKKQLQDVQARVASQFDDDGLLDIWVYDDEFARLTPVHERNLTGYVEREILQNERLHKFGRNDEPQVMADVIQKFVEEQPSTDPAFIVFMNDGGCKPGIKKWLQQASDQPLFWQFVGIGNGNFDLLRKLDTMGGRVVDNANFFHFTSLETVSDDELYDALLDEFPEWLQQAKAHGILT